MPDDGLPFCSVVVATRNRPVELARCIDALAALDYPRDRLEVLIADDGGSVALERTGEGLSITVVRTAGAGPAAARNRAAEHARGALLVFTDDDCLPAPDWLERVAIASRAAPDCAIGGRTVTAFPEDVFSAASQTVVDFVYAHYNRVPADARFFASNNLVVPARAFRELGGFDERFTTAEDREFCHRWLRSGRRLVYEPAAMVVHANALRLGRFAQQHFGYGRGAFAFHRARGGTFAASVASEGAFYLLLPGLARRAVAARSSARAQFASTLVIWQAANAAGFVWEAMRHVAGRGVLNRSVPTLPPRVAECNSARVAAS